MKSRLITLTVCVALFTASPSMAQSFSNRFDTDANADSAAQPTFSNNVPDASGTTTPTQTPATSAAGVEIENEVAKTAETASSETSSKKTKSIGGKARSFWTVLRNAGIMAIPIACCSMLLVMFIFERAISLRRRRVIPKHFVKLFLNELEEGQLKPEEALEQCQENRSPIAEVFAAAVKKWNRPSVEVEQAVIDAGEREANGLRRYLSLIHI